MNILFLTLILIDDINERGIYHDLIRTFARNGHSIYVATPLERRLKRKGEYSEQGGTGILKVPTFNIQKSTLVEKTLGIFLIEYQYLLNIKKRFKSVEFDLIIYSTPPINYLKIIKYFKKRYNTKTYLLLKDIFPQNAVDLGYFKKKSLVHKYFREKEKELYRVSDYIGCMSPANRDYILKNNLLLNKSKVEVNPNSIEPVDLQKFNCGVKEVKDKYGIPYDKVVLLLGGNIGAPQGIDFLVEVLKYYISDTRLFFIIAGSGTKEGMIRDFVRIHNPKNVLFIPAVPKHEFDKIVSISDVGLIFLDRKFTIPNYPSRLLTYLEFKKPVLFATDRNSDIGKIAEENGYGLWSESGDIMGFQNNLEKIIDKNLYIQMGENGYNYLLKNYTVQVSYDKIINHFI